MWWVAVLLCSSALRYTVQIPYSISLHVRTVLVALLPPHRIMAISESHREGSPGKSSKWRTTFHRYDEYSYDRSICSGFDQCYKYELDSWSKVRVYVFSLSLFLCIIPILFWIMYCSALACTGMWLQTDFTVPFCSERPSSKDLVQYLGKEVDRLNTT